MRFLHFALLACTLAACNASTSSPAPSDAGVDANVVCTGVCGGAAPSCARVYPSTSCFGGSCCELLPDAGPPFFDDAGSCPGGCASPDDIGCPGQWYRTNACAAGDLCCVAAPRDGSADH